MDEAQKQKIKKNLVALIQEIKCEETFLLHFVAQGAITKEEKDAIFHAAFMGSGGTTKAAKLLEILESRTNGWETLIGALQATSQTGPLGYLIGNPTSNDNSSQSNGNSELPKPKIVGNDGCRIGRIVRVIQGSPVGHTFLNKLGSFANDLDLKPGTKDAIMSSKELDNGDKLEKLLEKWRDENGSNATFAKLLKILKDFGSEDIHNALQDAI